MQRKQGFLRSPFVAAVIGGVTVGAFGWIAIAAGWVGDDESSGDSSFPISNPITRTTGDEGGGDSGGTPLSVSQIYQDRAPAVAFVAATRQSSVQTPFGPSPDGGAATGSGFVVDDQGHILTNAHVVTGSSEVE
ncbi:MAG: hypothetical protein ACR2N5_05065, partial [Solirubrobacterales bacterium]